MNRKLSLVNEWCKTNKLALNPTKSEYMLITNRFAPQQPEIFIGNNQVMRTNCFKYLGIYIDENLKFHNQIDNIKTKLSRLCGVSFRLSGYLNLHAAKNMYYSCVYATFSYCIGTWGGILLCTHRGDSLIKLQKKIVKTLFSKFCHDDTCLFRKNRILKLQDVYRFRVSVFMYKVMILSELPTLREDLLLEFPQHSHLTRSSGSLLTPFPRVEAIRMSYKYQFVQVWNEIPSTIRESRSLKLFRKSLVDNMLNTYQGRI